MSVTVSGYIMTHCKSIYVFALRFCLYFSQNICVSVWLYCHWLYVYVYVSWSVFTGTSLDPRFSLSFSLSVSVFGYIIGKSACIRTSVDSYFFVSLCLWMCVAVSDYISSQCRCKCTSLDSYVSLSSSLNVFIRVWLYWHWLYVYMYVFWCVFLSEYS